MSTFGDGVALVALMLRLQADGAPPYEVGLVLAAGAVPLLLLARPVGRLVDAIEDLGVLVRRHRVADAFDDVIVDDEDLVGASR